jgi:methionyl-tRNA synthetase
MMKMKKRYLVTAALPYANGPLHIGHLAGAYLPADIFCRYQRLVGKEVIFVCGSDEHGAAITIRAMKDGTTPQAIVDKYHVMLRDTFAQIGIKFDIYHRTSSPLHHETSQEFFRNLYKKGVFTEQTSQQYYDVEASQFLADRYIIGTCPVCGNEDAYGDQCEKCGSTLSPTELKNPRSAISGAVPELRPTTHWYLNLDQYEDWLREWINEGTLEGKQLHDPKEWKAHVLGQCNSWINQSLQPRAMTRDLDWGVDVPQEIPGAEGKKLYVWMDAPIGYVSATRQWATDHQKDWRDYWQSEDCGIIHFIGKDNIVFHCLIFPAILKMHGAYQLPINVPANQFMNLEGRKLSTSKNWAVWVHEFCEELPGQEDALRYNMIKNMPEQRDSEFTWKGFQETNNAELVNNLANFVNRVLVLTHKYFEGKVPAYQPQVHFKSGWQHDQMTDFGTESARMNEKIVEIGQLIATYRLRDALCAMMEISSAGNLLLQSNEPWKAWKENPQLVENVLFVSIQYVAVLAQICRPFLPFASDRLTTLLGLNAMQENGEWTMLQEILASGQPIVATGHQLNEPIHLFSRITDEVVEEQIAKLQAKAPLEEVKATVTNHDLPKMGSSAATVSRATAAIAAKQAIEYAPLKENIVFDDFAKMDIRTGTIVAAEAMPKSKKLLKLTVDLGFEQRTILSGISEHFTPDQVLGRQVIVLANLAPRLMMGVESNGMILMADNEDGALSFVSPIEGWSNGRGIN